MLPENNPQPPTFYGGQATCHPPEPLTELKSIPRQEIRPCATAIVQKEDKPGSNRLRDSLKRDYVLCRKGTFAAAAVTALIELEKGTDAQNKTTITGDEQDQNLLPKIHDGAVWGKV